MFMHASWLHIIGNMIFFWAFAPEIEEAMGRGRFLVFYIGGGLVAMLAQVAADPHSTVQTSAPAPQSGNVCTVLPSTSSNSVPRHGSSNSGQG
jgi:membrane associated rhomboid family serine protease